MSKRTVGRETLGGRLLLLAAAVVIVIAVAGAMSAGDGISAATLPSGRRSRALHGSSGRTCTRTFSASAGTANQNRLLTRQ